MFKNLFVFYIEKAKDIYRIWEGNFLQPGQKLSVFKVIKSQN
ncbi:hypothetical protein BFV94_0258 [Alteromonas macleodii]|uniref:Uncharacterized protein n=1 Tax=Alteromonas macleodii TaxID=28108 RepID=A0AB36FZE3_ALTMA|nr:hypothetical protein BFV94_0258 [Alteromonas macleodii]OES38061.1 hypothetical protein BFV93_0256 [Alteromonas macleodii]OES38129.1 hypothetical protein BFV95_0255 [Alteromonas macleodii]OES43291.1 hypothetical protein BFV96_0257 [Alteromonas macleodii]